MSGKAPPLPEMTISDLTRGQVFGDDLNRDEQISPALPDVRPAPQAGCFVSRLLASKDSAQITLHHRAFGTVAIESSSGATNLRNSHTSLPHHMVGAGAAGYPFGSLLKESLLREGSRFSGFLGAWFPLAGRQVAGFAMA